MVTNILDLPLELLVIIILFLLSSRDLLKLRCVLSSFHVLIEVPSLWRKFVWPVYRRCEETSVIKVLQVKGNCIRQMSVTNVQCVDFLLKPILIHCANVIDLKLVTQIPLSDCYPCRVSALDVIMQSLKKLEISWSYLLSWYPGHAVKGSRLTDLTFHLCR